MADLDILRDGELMVFHVQGNNEAGEMFLDGYTLPPDATVIDSGRLLMADQWFDSLVADAKACGLSWETRKT